MLQINPLEEMFDKQRVLQEQLGNLPSRNLEHHIEYLKEQCIALIDEVMEAMREVPWKSWKKHQTYNPRKHCEEIIDIWHFLINISLAAGMDADDIFEKFNEKNKVNIKRQEENY